MRTGKTKPHTKQDWVSLQNNQSGHSLSEVPCRRTNGSGRAKEHGAAAGERELLKGETPPPTPLHATFREVAW